MITANVKNVDIMNVMPRLTISAINATIFSFVLPKDLSSNIIYRF
jgi:hypothetical protein